MKLRLKTIGKIALVTVRIGGPIVTGVLGSAAGYKFRKKQEDPVYETLDRNERIKVAAPIFAPVVISAAVTVACSCIDKSLDMKHLKEMTKLYSAAALSSMTYRKKLEDKDPEAVKEADEEIEKTGQKYPMLPWNEEPEHSKNKGDELFVDSLTGRRFYSNMDDVSKALQAAEKDYEAAEWTEHLSEENKKEVYGVWPTRYLALNDLYEKLGIEQTWFGQSFGYVGVYDKDFEEWDYSGEHVGFHVEDGTDGSHYIMYDTMPMEGWYEI